MSTNDVPGANTINQDILKMGCWAENADGSLILVDAVEGNRVIFEIFDMAKSPIIMYRSAMPETSFKKTFSYTPTGNSTEKWTWHDKTIFPWDRIIQQGVPDGPQFATAEGLLTAAERVAQSLHLHGAAYDTSRARARGGEQQPKDAGHVILDKLQRALNELLR